MPQIMTQLEYSRHRGVTRQAVFKMVKEGRIPTITATNGQLMIDPEKADQALADRAAIRQPRIDEQPGYQIQPPGLLRAKTATEVYVARLKQIEYEERIGHLVRVDEVVRAMERCAEAIVRELDRLPLKAEELAAVLAAEGVFGMRVAMKNMMREVRRTLADNMRLLAEAEAEAETPQPPPEELEDE